MASGFQIVFEALDEASPAIQQLSQELAGAADQASEFAGQVESSTAEADDSLQKLPASAQTASESLSGAHQAASQLLMAMGGVTTAAGVVEFFKSSAQAAEDEEGALTRLAFAVNSTGQSFSAQKDKITAFAEQEAAMTKFSETDTYNALSRMTRVTGDVGQAMLATKLAFGMAATSGMDVGTVMNMLSPVMEGNTSRMITLKEQFGGYIGNATTAQEVVDALSKKFMNAAQTQDDSATKIARLTNRLQEFKVQVGEGVIPGIELFLDGLTKLAEYTEMAAAEIAGFAAKTVVAFQTLGRAIMDAWHGAWGQVVDDTRTAGNEITAVSDGVERDVTEIARRYSVKRAEAAQDEGQLRVGVMKKVAKASAQAEDDSAANAQKASDTMRKLQDDLLAAQGRDTQSRIGNIELERDKQLRAYQEMHDQGILTSEQLALAKQQETDKAKLQIQALTQAQTQGDAVMEKAGKHLSDSLESSMAGAIDNMILKGESWQDAFKQVMNAMLETAIKTFTKIALEETIFTSATGGIGAGLPMGLPGLAGGGVVTRPTVAVIGEKGPEAVIPLKEMGAAAPQQVNVTVHQNNEIELIGASDAQVQDLMRQMALVTRSGAAAGAELVKSIANAQARTSGQAV
ncbi:MAG: hypothetical protein ACYCPQ_00575 [Elusimicrobiota bacterium]